MIFFLLFECSGFLEENGEIRRIFSKFRQSPRKRKRTSPIQKNLIIYYMSNNTDIINNTLTKSIIAGVLAGAADYHFGRFASPTAIKFGAAVGVGVAVTSLLQLQPWPDTKEAKSIKFVSSRITESIGAATLAYVVDTSTWKSNSTQFDISYPYQFNENVIHRLGYIVAADIAAGIVTESLSSNSLFK